MIRGRAALGIRCRIMLKGETEVGRDVSSERKVARELEENVIPEGSVVLATVEMP